MLFVASRRGPDPGRKAEPLAKRRCCTQPGCREPAAFTPTVILRACRLHLRDLLLPTSIRFDLPLCRGHISSLTLDDLLTEDAMRGIEARFKGPLGDGPPPDWRAAYIARAPLA